MQRSLWHRIAVGVLSLALAGSTVLRAQPPTPTEPVTELSAPRPVPSWPPPCDRSCTWSLLEGPIFAEGQKPATLPPAQPDELYRPLPINLATALRLADARPLLIAAAQASVQVAVAQLERANVLWVPSLNAGASYIRHDGGNQIFNGGLINTSTNAFLAGGGLTTLFATTDAIFEPLAARQVLRSRQLEVQTARNDALFLVAQAYFNVQQARGRYAGALDTVTRGRELVKRVEALGKGLAPPIEVDRARTLLADLEQAAVSAHEDWRVASADLTRLLRLDPAAVVVPLEPPHLQVTLISPRQPVDDLVPVGLTYRPELASQQALVQATLARLRQERLRPLIPSLLLTGNSTPGELFTGGIFGSGSGSSLDRYAARSDVGVQVVWQVENLGFGNRARIRERQGQQQQALIDLFRIQDLVAAEVAQAHAQLESAHVRVGKAEIGLKEGLISYAGNLKGLSETIRFGDILQLVNRPQEVVAALQQLQQAYDKYFGTVGDYNRAQFRLFRALGYPAEVLACERPFGEIVPIETTRPPQMAPICTPPPCACPR